MATKSTNIRIDEDVKERAAALFASLGLGLSDAVNVFLRAALEENGFPFPVKKRKAELGETAESLEARRNRKFKEFLEFANANPVFEKGYKFDRGSVESRSAAD